MSALAAGWMLTYLLHSTLLLALAWLATRLLSDRQLALREMLWRVGLFGGLLTASLQLATGVAPFGGSWSLAKAPSPVRSQPLAPPPAEIALGVAAVGPYAITIKPTATVTAPRSVVRPSGWEQRLTRGWALIGLPLLTLLAGSYLRFRWRLRTRVDLDDGDLPEFLRRLEARFGAGGRRARPARLTRSSRIGVPLARGIRRGEICLPTAALERLPVERQEIVVAHELAHLDRRDPLWFGLTRILERAFFFQPLNTLARRQLQEISEFRCDDWAVAVTRRPISLAKCLTEVAEWSVRGRAALPVPTMAAGKSHLRRRVARLLERSYPMPSETLPRWLAPVALAVLLLTVLIAPGVSAHAPEPPARPAEPAPVEAPVAPELPPAPAALPAPVALPAPAPLPAPPAPQSAAPAVAPTAATPPLPAAPVVPAAPAIPPPPPAPELSGFGAFDAFATFDAFDNFNEFGEFGEFEEFGELVGELGDELNAQLLPMLAELSAELDPALAAEHAELAAEIAAERTERPELDPARLARLREMAERLERQGLASEAESARLAEMAEHLAETARPSREQIEKLREQARQMAETGRLAMEAHRARLLEAQRTERDAMAGARDEIRRSLEERRELIERARETRTESLRELDRENRERLRQEMQRSREQLREQLRTLDEELERQDREAAEGERSQPVRE